MAVENAANPAHPKAAACGPARKPSIPPVMHPAIVPLDKVVFPRCDSIRHSVAENIAPTTAKFLAYEPARDLMSFMISLAVCSCWPVTFVGILESRPAVNKPNAPPSA